MVILLLGMGLAVIIKADSPVIVEKPLTDDDRAHWAYGPLAPVKTPDARSGNPVDVLLLSSPVRRGRGFAPSADPATLLRRLTFDLTGLPPTPEALSAFLKAPSDNAYLAEVDRLLRSKACAENLARHWLDLARFAETDGFEFDTVRSGAWRYRDWVVEALQRDLPYDEFVRAQIAGDLLEGQPDRDWLALGSGFLLSGPDMPDVNDQEERRHTLLNEMTGTVGVVFLSTSLGCAQCHDHPYDPVSQADFYRMRAVFEETVTPAARKPIGTVVRASAPGLAPLPRLWVRGDPHTPGPEVSAAAPRILRGEASEALPKGSERLAFARWLTSETNAIFLRSIANRLWLWHFGQPLVATPNDFGTLAAIPDQRVLLDWLAGELPRRAWSIREMQRLLVTSQAYRQRGGTSKEDSLRNRRRLSGEEIRDALLSLSGALNPKSGGPGVRYPLPPEITVTLLANQREVDPDPAEHDRRSLYLFARRNLRHPLFDAFDRPDALASCARRPVSTTAPQVLMLLNSPFTHRLAGLAAARVAASGDAQIDGWIERASRLILSRDPTPQERQLATAFFDGQVDTSRLADFCLALFNSNAFLYVE